MVDKELVVTLVPDCCFSATVYRNGGPSVRYLPYDLATALERSLDPENGFTGRGTRSANRGASIRDNWLVEPDRYAILAACGPDENVREAPKHPRKG